MRSVLCLIAVSIVNACDEHHCWCWFENCQKYIYIVGRKKSTLVYWRYIYYGCDVYFPVVCIYIQQPPFLNSNREIQIHFTHAIHFVSVKSHFIQTNNQKKIRMKCYFLCIFLRPVFCMWCKNETAKIITPNFPICQMKRKWIKLWSEFFSMFCFAISLPYKR